MLFWLKKITNSEFHKVCFSRLLPNCFKIFFGNYHIPHVTYKKVYKKCTKYNFGFVANSKQWDNLHLSNGLIFFERCIHEIS